MSQILVRGLVFEKGDKIPVVERGNSTTDQHFLTKWRIEHDANFLSLDVSKY